MPLRRALVGHEVATAYECGWSDKQNGDLLKAAEAEGFEAMITTDQNLRYQQDLGGRRLSILVLMTTDWRRIRPHTNTVVYAIGNLKPGGFRELQFPPTSSS